MKNYTVDTVSKLQSIGPVVKRILVDNMPAGINSVQIDNVLYLSKRMEAVTDETVKRA